MKRSIWKKIQAEFVIWRMAALPGVAVTGLIVALRLTGYLQFLELLAFDQFLRSRSPEPTDSRIVIIGINEADIRQMGTYPIPDRTLAQLLQKIHQAQPAAIGLDIVRDVPVQPGHAELVKSFREINQLFVVETVLPDSSGYTIAPPPDIAPEQVGFADAVFDRDGALRRSLLATATPQGEVHFSLTLRLAEAYLEQHKIESDEGQRDNQAVRFGSIELTRVTANSGGYVNTDDFGNQILLNFRNGHQPFRLLSLHDIQTGQFDPQWIRGKVVLVGMTAGSVKDIVNSSVIGIDNPALNYGVAAQAHAVSQILSTVLDHRPLLNVWSDDWEYLWIVGWGLLGISLGRILRSPWKILLGLGVAGVALLGVSYGLLIWGWWIPFVPAALALGLNGAGLTAALFYRYERDLKARLQDRQMIIDHTFNTIHNGPLQTLAQLLREVQEQELPTPLLANLQHLNQELRAVYESVRKETLEPGDRLFMGIDFDINLQAPLHEVLYEVYETTLNRDFPCFRTLKIKVVNFEPVDEQRLSMEQKRGLCRFLEEALCNVGKHATGVTRIDVSCHQSKGRKVIRVVDNGVGIVPNPTRREGMGTQQAKRLARQLSGKFQRAPHPPQGTVCELTWSVMKAGIWRF